MTGPERLAARLFGAIGRALPSPVAEVVRGFWSMRFGVCRVCDATLDGPSPCQVCEPCHTGEMLAAALGTSSRGEG